MLSTTNPAASYVKALAGYADITAVKVTPDQRHLLVGISSRQGLILGEIAVLSIPDMEFVARDQGIHLLPVTTFAHIGRKLYASGSDDGTVALWAILGNDIRKLCSLPARGRVQQLAYLPKTRELLVSSEGWQGIETWRINDLIAEFKRLGLWTSELRSLEDQ